MAGDQAQSIKCLLYKNEGLNLIPRTLKKRKRKKARCSGVHFLLINQDRRVPGAPWPAGQVKSASFRLMEDLVSKNKVEDFGSRLIASS